MNQSELTLKFCVVFKTHREVQDGIFLSNEWPLHRQLIIITSQNFPPPLFAESLQEIKISQEYGHFHAILSQDLCHQFISEIMKYLNS